MVKIPRGITSIIKIMLVAVILIINIFSKNVYSQVLVTVYVKFPDNSPCSFCTIISSSGSIAIADQHGKANLVLKYDDYVYASYVFTLYDTAIIYSGGKTYSGGGTLEIVVTTKKCFYPINFTITPQAVQPNEDVTIEVSWIFAKCCPNCIVYVTLYMGNNLLGNIWSSGDYNYTHKLITAWHKFKAPQNPGIYEITLNVAYAYQPPQPNEGIVRKNRLYVITPPAYTTTYTIIIPTTYTTTRTITTPTTSTTTQTLVFTEMITKTIETTETITKIYEYTTTVEKEVLHTITERITGYTTYSVTISEYFTETLTKSTTVRETITIYTNTITTTFTGLINIEVKPNNNIMVYVTIILVILVAIPFMSRLKI